VAQGGSQSPPVDMMVRNLFEKVNDLCICVASLPEGKESIA
jgi:hypothetical protein